jgi:23S rRNA (uridine2552-2'-O)-methyltransferase
MTIVDLGAAPGGWSQLVAGIVGPKGKVYALDILPMDSLANVEFLQGDFREESVMQEFLHRVQSSPIDAVISDMAPNFSGMRSVDQPRAMYLAELALDFTQRVLRPKGCFIIKTFQGEGFEAFLKELRRLFTKVTIKKPSASRATSAEVYLVAVAYNRTK